MDGTVWSQMNGTGPPQIGGTPQGPLQLAQPQLGGQPLCRGSAHAALKRDSRGAQSLQIHSDCIRAKPLPRLSLHAEANSAVGDGAVRLMGR
jgi:hypothetical protein